METLRVFEVFAKGIGGEDERRRVSVLRRSFPTGWTLIGFCGPDSVEIATTASTPILPSRATVIRGACFTPRGEVTLRDVMDFQDAPGRILSRALYGSTVVSFTLVLSADGKRVVSRGNAAIGNRTTGFGDLPYWRNHTTQASFAGGNELTDAGRAVLEGARR